ncbi:hypothetical protein [Salinispora cortesiana]|uniref:hypothetical protein n=1 Tax=Salinispora cortesiana TaxID=1305843 RepID=UPI00046E58EC|nr:hypothetical protein [Salinispora cortesiana]
MAFRTLGKLLLTALGVGLLAGAGQLGVAFGFGIVRFSGAFTSEGVNQWPAQLAWVGWLAANAAVTGAICAERLARRAAPLIGAGRQVAVAGAAALGATVVAPLGMQSARAADVGAVEPVWAVAAGALLGAVVGGGAALAVLMRPPLLWSMAFVAGLVWLLALASVAPSLNDTGPLRAVRLGVWEPSWLDPAVADRLCLLGLPVAALLAGAGTGGLARRRGQATPVGALAGLPGPVLLAGAYLAAGPGTDADRYQATPYYAALLAVVAGGLGSAAAAMLRWPLIERPVERAATILRWPLSNRPVEQAATTAAAATEAAADAAGTDSAPGTEPTADPPTHPAPAAVESAPPTTGNPVPATRPRPVADEDEADPDTAATATSAATSADPLVAGATPPAPRRRNLFRRSRSQADEAGEPAAEVRLAAQDEEFVDWVTGLSKPVPNNEPDPDSARRSLRSIGRHHAD